MVHKSGGKGTYLIDRRFPGIGRIRRATGTRNKVTFKAIDGMLSALWANGRTDILTQVRDGLLHPMTVYGQYRVTGIHDLPTMQDMTPILDKAFAWLERYDCSSAHRRNMRSSFRSLQSIAPHVTMDGLVSALMKLRENQRDRPAMFNRTKHAVAAFLRDTCGKSYRVCRDVRDVPTLKEPQKHGNPQTPDQLREITADLREPYASMVWSMALTGMGPKEYWGRWEVLEDRVVIYGTKRAARMRSVPIAGNIVCPTRVPDVFKRVLRAETDIQPYDLRRSYATWLEAAGIPRTRRRLYLGHAEKDVTDRYERHDITEFLVGDAQRITRFLMRGPQYVPQPATGEGA